MTPSIHQSWRTVAQWHRLRKMTEISNMQHRQAQHAMICVLLPQKRGVSTPQSSSIFMILVDVQHPRVPKSAFIPQKVEVKQLSHKASKVFQFPESQIHLQSIIQGMKAILGFVRTLRNLNISSCDPDFSKCSAIQNLHDVFSSLLLHHGAKEGINVSRCFSCNAMNRSKYEEQQKQTANENETNLNLNYVKPAKTFC